MEDCISIPDPVRQLFPWMVFRLLQRTPAVIYGLKEGTYTVRLSLEQTDPVLREKADIKFEDQEVYVPPFSIVPVDVAANNSQLTKNNHRLPGSQGRTVYRGWSYSPENNS